MEDEYSSSDDSQSEEVESGEEEQYELDEYSESSGEDSSSDEEEDSSDEEATLKLKDEKLRQKLKECALVLPGYEDTQPPWSELLVITSNVTTEDMNIDDSLALEKHFFNQSMDAVAESMKLLKAEGTL